MRARNDRAPALVRIGQTGDALEKCGVARAVAADQREPSALPEVELQFAEQPALALDQTEVFVAKDLRGHGRPLRRASGASQCVCAAFCASTIAATSSRSW